MKSLGITALVTLAASIALAAPIQKLEARLYPTVDTYVAQMTEVSPTYLSKVANVVVNLDPTVPGKRDEVESRQTSTCDIQGFAIVSGSTTPFQGTVLNSVSNWGRAVTLTGILPGCSVGLIPQSDCTLWSIIDTNGCATARSVTFF